MEEIGRNEWCRGTVGTSEDRSCHSSMTDSALFVCVRMCVCINVVCVCERAH